MTIKIYFKRISLIIFFITSVYAQTDPIITEVMFNPNGSNTEYVELYNPTASTIDLINYQIKYSTSAGDFILSISDSTLLAPMSFAVVVEGDYDSNNSPYSIPISALIVKIDDNAFGSSGMANTSDREIFLLDGIGNTLSTYVYSANNSTGISDEKIVLNTDNSSSNWANSIAANGTPGYKNSVSPKEKDLSVTNIQISPSPIITGTTLTAAITIKNLGTTTASSFNISLYDDGNFDANPAVSELISTITLNNLSSGDSTIRNFNLGTYPVGDARLIAVVSLSGDEDNSNDTLTINFFVNPVPPEFNDVVINEIMYDPSSEELDLRKS